MGCGDGRILSNGERSKTTTEGLAIGRALARHRAELHGGKIWMENDIGKGTTISLLLPFNWEIVQSQKMQLFEIHTDPPASMRKSDVLLVVIDDNRNSLKLLTTSLEQQDLEIAAFSDPEEAMEAIYTLHPQIVITDLVMPALGGFEVLDRVMRFDPSIDVVLMTGHYSTESAVEAAKKGATDYLNKPVSITRLRARIFIGQDNQANETDFDYRNQVSQ